jgi:hypothetical protein
MTAPLNAGLATVELYGEEIALPSVGQCHVCSSKYRSLIDEGLLGSHTYKGVVALLPPDANITPRNVADHFRRGHLPVNEAAIAVLRSEQGRERGQAVQPVAEAVADKVIAGLPLMRRILTKGSQLLEEGELRITTRDLIASAEFIAKWDDDGLDLEAVAKAIRLVMEEAKTVMTQPQWSDFSVRLTSNATLRQLISA